MNIEPAICNGHLPYVEDGIRGRGGEGLNVLYLQVGS